MVHGVSSGARRGRFRICWAHNARKSPGSLLKHSVIGTYHNVSRRYLPLYLNEFSFRFNYRKNARHLRER